MACPEDILCAAAMGCVFEGTLRVSLDVFPCGAKLYVWSGWSLLRHLTVQDRSWVEPNQLIHNHSLSYLWHVQRIFCVQHQWDVCLKEDWGSVWMLSHLWQNCKSGQDLSLLRHLTWQDRRWVEPNQLISKHSLSCLWHVQRIFCVQQQWDLSMKESWGSVWMLRHFWQNCMSGQDSSLLREPNGTQPTDS